MINSTVIVGDNGVILVDSGGTAEVGQHIAAAVRRITDKPVTHVVNTHHHGDHYLGNVAFEGAELDPLTRSWPFERASTEPPSRDRWAGVDA